MNKMNRFGFVFVCFFLPCTQSWQRHQWSFRAGVSYWPSVDLFLGCQAWPSMTKGRRGKSVGVKEKPLSQAETVSKIARQVQLQMTQLFSTRGEICWDSVFQFHHRRSSCGMGSFYFDFMRSRRALCEEMTTFLCIKDEVGWHHGNNQTGHRTF